MAYDRAVVIGGGIGGLMSARVLADHYEEVLVIDRDTIPGSPDVRNGAPQGNHFHAILPGGLGIMNRLFPGFEKDLESCGSLIPRPEQFYFFTPEGRSFSLMRFKPEPTAAPPDWPKVHVQTRGLLEHCLRRRVEALPNVTTRYESMVRELLVVDGRVRGVRIEETGEALEADLVIDATGRVSRTLSWLDTLGYARPEASEIRCDFAYSTARFRPHDPDAFTDVGYFMAGDPQSPYPNRGGALVRMEDGTLMATVGGRHGDHPPRDLDGFLAYAATLIEPSFLALISDAEAVTELHHFKFPKSVRRHYERLTAFPDGLLPIGDAICHFNPVYGQGMSAASREAQALGQLLGARKACGETADGLWRDFFKAAYEQTRAPWLLAAVADFQVAGTEGDFPVEEQSVLQTLMRLNERAHGGDDEAELVIGRVQSMQEPLSLLEDEQVRARFL